MIVDADVICGDKCFKAWPVPAPSMTSYLIENNLKVKGPFVTTECWKKEYQFSLPVSFVNNLCQENKKHVYESLDGESCVEMCREECCTIFCATDN